MCWLCGTRMRGGPAVHASTTTHRRNDRRRQQAVRGNRLSSGRPAWATSLDRWDDQYDL